MNTEENHINEIEEIRTSLSSILEDLISIDRKARNLGIKINGFNDVTSKINEFVLRLKFRQNKRE